MAGQTGYDAVSLKFRSSFFSTKYTSLGAYLPAKSFSETVARIHDCGELRCSVVCCLSSFLRFLKRMTFAFVIMLSVNVGLHFSPGEGDSAGVGVRGIFKSTYTNT